MESLRLFLHQPVCSFHWTETKFATGAICHKAPRFQMNGVQRNNHSRTTSLSVSTAVTPTGPLAIGQRCNHRADWRGFKRRYEARCSVCCIRRARARLSLRKTGGILRACVRISARRTAGTAGLERCSRFGADSDRFAKRKARASPSILCGCTRQQQQQLKPPGSVRRCEKSFRIQSSPASSRLAS